MKNEIIAALERLPGVEIIDVGVSDKVLCCVKITVQRKETVNSGSMMFNHLRYITFGQMVWFDIKPPVVEEVDVAPSKTIGGAIGFEVENAGDVLYFMNNLHSFVPHEKEPPMDGGIMVAET